MSPGLSFELELYHYLLSIPASHWFFLILSFHGSVEEIEAKSSIQPFAWSPLRLTSFPNEPNLDPHSSKRDGHLSRLHTPLIRPLLEVPVVLNSLPVVFTFLKRELDFTYFVLQGLGQQQKEVPIRGLQPAFRPMHRELDQDQLLLKLFDLALELTIERRMLGEVMALFQDMHLEPGLQPALKLALHWGSPVSKIESLAVFGNSTSYSIPPTQQG
uniref:Uncharacterized protein n=1 Tax=Salix viminalis TaxID=40686 RepID=A0A6N2KC74_SALVM